MAQRLTINYEKKPCYDIVFAQDFGGLGEELEELNISQRKLCIVTDSTVEKLYAQNVLEAIQDKCRKAFVLSLQ